MSPASEPRDHSQHSCPTAYPALLIPTPGWFCVSAAWTARPFDLDNYTSTNCLCPAAATAGKCLAGSFCPEGSPEPRPCLPGSFCATSGKDLRALSGLDAETQAQQW